MTIHSMIVLAAQIVRKNADFKCLLVAEDSDTVLGGFVVH